VRKPVFGITVLLALSFRFDRPLASRTSMEGGAGDVAMIGKDAIGSWYACGKALRQGLASFVHPHK